MKNQHNHPDLHNEQLSSFITELQEANRMKGMSELQKFQIDIQKNSTIYALIQSLKELGVAPEKISALIKPSTEMLRSARNNNATMFDILLAFDEPTFHHLSEGKIWELYDSDANAKQRFSDLLELKRIDFFKQSCDLFALKLQTKYAPDAQFLMLKMVDAISTLITHSIETQNANELKIGMDVFSYVNSTLSALSLQKISSELDSEEFDKHHESSRKLIKSIKALDACVKSETTDVNSVIAHHQLTSDFNLARLDFEMFMNTHETEERSLVHTAQFWSAKMLLQTLSVRNALESETPECKQLTDQFRDILFTKSSYIFEGYANYNTLSDRIEHAFKNQLVEKFGSDEEDNLTSALVLGLFRHTSSMSNFNYVTHGFLHQVNQSDLMATVLQKDFSFFARVSVSELTQTHMGSGSSSAQPDNFPTEHQVNALLDKVPHLKPNDVYKSMVSRAIEKLLSIDCYQGGVDSLRDMFHVFHTPYFTKTLAFLNKVDPQDCALQLNFDLNSQKKKIRSNASLGSKTSDSGDYKHPISMNLDELKLIVLCSFGYGLLPREKLSQFFQSSVDHNTQKAKTSSSPVADFLYSFKSDRIDVNKISPILQHTVLCHHALVHMYGLESKRFSHLRDKSLKLFDAAHVGEIPVEIKEKLMLNLQLEFNQKNEILPGKTLKI